MSGRGRPFRSAGAALGLGAVIGLAACSDQTAADSEADAPPAITEAEARTAQFSPVELTFDADLLDERQKHVVRHLVEASRELDLVFRLQKWAGNGNPHAVLPAATGP
ncbi:MAG: hypothetical protein ACE5FP_08560, partial [Gemmatimonadota bacterium]